MPKYIMLTTLTDQGLQTLRSNPERLRAVNKDVEELGVKVLHQWACLGPFDFVNVVEAPDAATISRMSVILGARGSAKLQSYELMEIDDFLGVDRLLTAGVRWAILRGCPTGRSRAGRAGSWTHGASHRHGCCSATAPSSRRSRSCRAATSSAGAGRARFPSRPDDIVAIERADE